MALNNPFEAWTKIIDRVKTVSGIRGTYSLPDFFSAQDLTSFPTPAIFVGFGGETIDNRAGFGRRTIQTYIIWILCSNSSGISNHSTLLSHGELVDSIDFRLADFEPTTQYQPLIRVTSGDPVQYFPGGYSIIPLWYQSVYMTKET